MLSCVFYVSKLQLLVRENAATCFVVKLQKMFCGLRITQVWSIWLMWLQIIDSGAVSS